MQMSFREMVPDSLCRNSSVVQTHSFISCLGAGLRRSWQASKLDVEVLGWSDYMWSAVVRPVGRSAKFFKTTLEVAYGRDMNIQLSGNSSSGHSCSEHANCKLPQNLRHFGKTAHFGVAFYCPHDHAV